MKRVSTGNPELDLILGGGLPQGSLNVVMGAPGIGKTLLAQQLAFANVDRERPAVYLSTLSEPLDHVLAYLQETDFAEIHRIGDGIHYDSLAPALLAEPEAVPARIQEIIQRYRPAVLIIDSFKAVADLMPDVQTWRRVVFELAGVLGAYDVTTLWVGEYLPTGGYHDQLEFAVADGILELRRHRHGGRDDRLLRVDKLRGSAFRDGDHVYDLSERGMTIYPRLLPPRRSEVSPRGDTPAPIERLESGIHGLDDMIEAGWLRGSATLVTGPSGAGKTMLGLHFLRRGAERDEPGLLLGFQENPPQLRRQLVSLGWDTDTLLGPGRIDHLYRSPVEMHVDVILREVFERLAQHRVKRVVVDAVGDLERCATSPERFHDYLYSFLQHLVSQEVTVMLLMEVPAAALTRAGGGQLLHLHREVSNMSDNILQLDMELVGSLTHTIRVTKSRSSAHDLTRHVLKITDTGLAVE